MALPRIYKTRDKQSIWDLSVQLYGDLSKIGILLELFPNLDNELTLNSSITVDEQKDPIAKEFLDKGMIIATDFTSTGPVGDRILREDSSFLLREDGFYILRES